jgi:2,4-dienoyl-CoA reductase-like NADH-dependent reductase (Old Yellow Enzyme family)
LSNPLLFTPLTIAGVTLKNRIVIAPMHQYSAEQGFATDWHVMNAGRYAAGGAGLVIVESTKVARNGCGTVGDTALWDDKFIPAMTRVADFIKQHGAVAGIQLGHSGRKARLTRPWEGGKPLKGNEPEIYDWEGWELVAPSAVPHTEKSPTPRAMTNAEVKQMARNWAAAATRADACGFDMLEIHAAHGYLIHQFLSPVSNIRNDEYGGSEENRMRFAVEVAEAVRAVWPSHKPLFMRLSCVDDAGWDIDQSVRLSARLKQSGIDVIDCSSGGTLKFSPMDGERSQRYGYQVPSMPSRSGAKRAS